MWKIQTSQLDQYLLSAEADEVLLWMFARVEQNLLYEFMRAAPEAVVQRLLAVLSPKICRLVSEDLELVEMPSAERIAVVREQIAAAIEAILLERAGLAADDS